MFVLLLTTLVLPHLVDGLLLEKEAPHVPDVRPKTICSGSDAVLAYHTLEGPWNASYQVLVCDVTLSRGYCQSAEEWQLVQGCSVTGVLQGAMMRCSLKNVQYNRFSKFMARVEVRVKGFDAITLKMRSRLFKLPNKCDEIVVPPPMKPSAQPQKQRQMLIEWESVKGLAYNFEIYYHAQDEKNMTVQACSGSTSYTIQGLYPFTEYFFYMRAYDMHKRRSTITGPFTATTLEEVPGQPPIFLKELFRSTTASDVSRYRNVTLVWKQPPSTSFNGRLKGFFLEYKQAYRVWQSHMLKDANVTEFTLMDLEKKSWYTVKLRLCNSVGCSEEEETIIRAAPQTEALTVSQEHQAEGTARIVALLGACLGFAVILLLVVLRVMSRPRRRQQRNGHVIENPRIPDIYYSEVSETDNQYV